MSSLSSLRHRCFIIDFEGEGVRVRPRDFECDFERKRPRGLERERERFRERERERFRERDRERFRERERERFCDRGRQRLFEPERERLRIELLRSSYLESVRRSVDFDLELYR